MLVINKVKKMTVNKKFKKFPIGSIVAYITHPLTVTPPYTPVQSKSYGLVINADKQYLHVMIKSSILKIDIWTINRVRGVQRPYQKYVQLQ